jgi:hypothetical protein
MKRAYTPALVIERALLFRPSRRPARALGALAMDSWRWLAGFDMGS